MSVEQPRDADALGVELISRRAANPGPMTLAGSNSYVLRDGDQTWVVDPGPRDAQHLAALIGLATAGGRRPVGVLVTHRHGDHSDGAGTLRRQLEARSGASVKLWAQDGEAVPGAEPPPSSLQGDEGLVASVLHLPGHTADSVGLLVEGGRMLTGDTLLGGSSTVIAPPDGDLHEYLQSLSILRAMTMDGRIAEIHPGHGDSIDDPLAALDAIETALNHRRERIEEVRRARAAGVMTLDRLIREVYGPDLPEDLQEPARWNLRATLAYLSREDQGRSRR